MRIFLNSFVFPLFISIVSFFISVNSVVFSQDFVSVQGAQFYLKGLPYTFMGTNLWYGMNLGSFGPGGDRVRLIKELDELQAIGVKNLRVMAASEGPNKAPWRVVPSLQEAPGVYSKQLLEGLDFLLSEMGKRDMKAVVCLNNMWPWTGGFAQYINWVEKKEIPYPPPAEQGNWLRFIRFSSRFFNNKEAQRLYRNHIRHIITRINSISGKPYVHDPTIMAWQLANEPRALGNNRKYYQWVEQTGGYIKSLDKNHLVSVGSEGNAVLPYSRKFKKEHASRFIDYCTVHIWVQNWKWYSPEKTGETSFEYALKKAQEYLARHLKQSVKLNKPFVLDEFGLARDFGNYSYTSTVDRRDRYYTEVFKQMNQYVKEGNASGVNFWAWSGSGRPKSVKSVWKQGDDFTGDPPFEYQGWYSVYNTDSTTIQVLKKYARALNSKAQ